MTALDRSFWLALAAMTYIGTAGMQLDGITSLRLVALFAQAAVLARVWTVSKRRQETAGPESGAAPACLRLAAAGAVVWLTARLGPSQAVALELAAAAGLACATCGALFALARVPYGEGLLRPVGEVSAGKPGDRSRLSRKTLGPQPPPPRPWFQRVFRPGHATHSLDATLLAGGLWLAVWVITVLRFSPQPLILDPLALDYTTATASIGSLLVLISATFRLRVLRKLELGTGDRALGALAFATTGLGVAVPAAAFDLAPPDRILPASVLAACLCSLWTLLVEDARRVAAVLRATMVLTAVALPIALLGGALATKHPEHAGAITLAGSALCLVAGLVAREAARPLGPEQSRWLEAISNAQQAALVPEPRAAIIATLGALKRTSVSPQARPELYMRNPPLLQTVDVAGYLHEEAAQAPDELYTLGMVEPERTLRAEVLAALRVKRPGVRALLDWFDVRRAFSATIICDDDGPVGFLLLPRGDRVAPLSLDEAKALRALADRLSALVAVTSALERARVRQYAAEDLAGRAAAERDDALRRLGGQVARNNELASLLSRPLLDNAFSPAVRLALRTLQAPPPAQRAHLLLVPVGVPLESWAAAIHIARRGRSGALVIIDGAFESERRCSAWSSSDLSPLQLAAGGTLVVKNLELASAGVQDILTTAILETRPTEGHRGPEEIVLATASPPAQLVQQGRLQPSLQLLVEATVQLPTLEERPEDLRSLIISTLARCPYHGESGPFGVDRVALQCLLDHTWQGNESELQDVLSRAAATASGSQITFESLRALGFNSPAFADEPGPPLRSRSRASAGAPSEAVEVHRRRSRRRPPRRPH